MAKLVKEPIKKSFMNGQEVVKVAAIQAAYVACDKEKSIEKACRLIKEAGRNGAQLVAFPEAYITCFPNYYTSGLENLPESQMPWILGIQNNSVVVPSEDTERIGRACREAGVICVMGMNEMDPRPGCYTMYNTNVLFDSDGKILGRHRKLKPTRGERIYWGEGDGSDLGVYDTAIGRVGTLICWEHHTLLIKAAQMLMGEEFHIANWPGSWRDPLPGEKYGCMGSTQKDECDLTFGAREYAFESRAFVISVCGLLRDEDFLPGFEQYRSDEHMNYDWACGGSFICGLSGQYLAEPVFKEEAILYADCEANEMKLCNFFFDGLGHYSRPALTQLTVDTTDYQNLKLMSSDNGLKELSEAFEMRMEKVENMMQMFEKVLAKNSKLKG